MINETAASSDPPIAKPATVAYRRVTASIGSASSNRVGLYKQNASAIPLNSRLSLRSQTNASARQKNPNSDVCPPARHSTRKGANDSPKSSAVRRASDGAVTSDLEIRP